MVVFFEVKSRMARYLSTAAAAQGAKLKLEAAQLQLGVADLLLSFTSFDFLQSSYR